MTTVQAIEHIEKIPGTVGGRAKLVGRRISVAFIVDLYINQATSLDEFWEGWDISPAEVHSALAYYYDHQNEIDKEIEDEYDETDQNTNAVEVILQRWKEKYGYDPTEELTASQIAEEYGIKPATVRQACLKGWVSARKSGASWLIRRHSAHARWNDGT